MKNTKVITWNWKADGSASAIVEGFTLHLKIVADPDADTSYLDQDDFADRKDQYERDQFSFEGAIVTVYRAGVELAFDSLWGIESDSGRDYFVSVADGLADEAIERAKVAIAHLCSGVEDSSAEVK
jgi:hypothetical protein